MHLEDQLRSLGEHLDVGDDTEDALPARVLARLDRGDDRIERHRRTWLRAAAAVLVTLTIAVAAIPASRDTVAGWFGLDGVRIERDVSTKEPKDTSTVEDGPAPLPASETSVVGLPGPGSSREVTVDGQVVLVSVIEGVLTNEVVVKTLNPDTEIAEVAVGNAPGLWISGAPHELAYESPDGLIQFERVAGNTLVWQNDDVIGRLEGFDSLDAALEFAFTVGT